MPTIEETQDDDVIEDVEEAKIKSKRSKTKYGDRLNDE